jgi:TRAP-type uncharacterized transport system substrate-binding protein
MGHGRGGCGCRRARSAVADAQEAKFFRIGTGGAGGTYFPIGGLIANAISAPPGSMPCDKGGACGVPGLVAIAQTTITKSDIQAAELNSQQSADRMADGQLDAFFIVGGSPLAAVAQLAATKGMELYALSEEEQAAFLKAERLHALHGRVLGDHELHRRRPGQSHASHGSQGSGRSIL